MISRSPDSVCAQGLACVCGFKEEPVEWVYTGVGPLLPRDVLASRKGVAASLALLASCVSRRLHVHLLPYLPPGAAQAGEPILLRWVCGVSTGVSATCK